MQLSRALLLALAGFSRLAVAAEDEIKGEVLEDVEINPPHELQVDVKATLPEASMLGIKIFNGRPTKSVIKIVNNEPKPVKVHLIGGSLWSEGLDAHNLRNLTSSRYEADIPAGETQNVDYMFTTDMRPQDVSLILGAMLSLDGEVYQVQALNTTVSVVDEAASIFDPQILFLYIVLLGVFTGTAYLIYSTWIAPMFPSKSKRRFDVKAGRKSAPATPSADSASASGAKSYDESWIPEHHLRKPEVKRSRSGTPAGKSKKA